MTELKIPIFPLPEVVFFPETVLPLHVFEPRYRRMVADCLSGDGRMAVAMLRPGWEQDYHGRPPVHPVAGVGEIIHAETLADGRYNILLDGQMRVRIESELSGDLPYRRGLALHMADVLPPEGMTALTERLLTLRAAHGQLLEALGQGHADVVGRLTVAGAAPGAMVDRIASAVIPDATVRQRILETANVSERLDLATAALLDLLTLVSGSEGEDDSRED
ncbi:MAG: LON peptidase substrate-binding domain-containing protein [Actinomycetota bacterium]